MTAPPDVTRPGPAPTGDPAPAPGATPVGGPVQGLVAAVGGAGGWSALAWAVEEAAAGGGHLTLLHVPAPGSPLERSPARHDPAGPPVAWLELADLPLARALAAARRRLGPRRVTLCLATGSPAAALGTAGGDLLVLGAGGNGRTAWRTARAASRPVVVVPGPAGPAPEVVVGVGTGAPARAALAFAFGHARRHGLAVVAVRAADPARTADAEALLRDATAPLRRAYPGCPVRYATTPGDGPADLAGAAAAARLLVVGAPRGGPAHTPVTGRAERPVAVVPADAQRGELR